MMTYMAIRALQKIRSNRISPELQREGGGYEISPVGHGVSPNMNTHGISPVYNPGISPVQPGSDDLDRDPFSPNPDAPTIYDERHVVAERNGEKIIMIPFHENTNLLDGISGLDQPVQRKPTVSSKKIDKQKTAGSNKKNNMESILKSLESVDRDSDTPSIEKMPIIPAYQLRNRPYATTRKEDPNKVRNKMNQRNLENDNEDEEEEERDREEEDDDEEGPESARSPNRGPNRDQNKGRNNGRGTNRNAEEQPKKQASRACNIF